MKIYLVSGANRGLGLGLVQSLLKDTDNVVYAGVRDPTKSSGLDALKEAHKDRLYVVRLAAGDVEDAKNASDLIEKKQGHLDVLIANAGICDYYAKFIDTDLSQFTRHFEVNVLGPIVLYQQLRDVLAKSSEPKFIGISTEAAVLTKPSPIEDTPYVVSKAGFNAMIQKITLEEPTFTSIAISPGWVQTDMGNFGAKSNGLEQAPLSIDDSVNGLMRVIHEAKKETHNGILWNYNGEKLDW